MAARPSMLDLIARIRGMIGDPDVGDPALLAFTDNDLQEALDERRTDVVEAQLRYRPTIGNARLLFTDLFAPRRAWEDNVVLSGPAGNVLTPDTSDLIAGHWTFTAGTPIPVFITGSFYDLNGTASGVCQAWAAKLAREFDFGTDQQTFNRSQKSKGLLAISLEYARSAVPPGRMPAWRGLDW